MNKNQFQYTLALRIATFFIVAFLWYLSIIWSADGFSINNSELAWIGIGLALSVTIAQLVFNRGSANPTIFLVGLAAYLYGFTTNFVGISKVMGLNFTLNNLDTNPFGFIISGLGVTALAIIVEAAPESFLLWALYPEEKSPGDFISSLLRGANLPKSNMFKNQPRSSIGFSVPNRTEHPRSVPTNRSVQTNRSVPFEPALEQYGSKVEQEVNSYVQRYKQQNKGKTPGYRDIVKNTSLTSTSQVAQYIKR